MRLDDQAVHTGGDRAAAYGYHQAALARRVRGVREYRQVRELFNGRNCVQIERVTRVGLEGPDPPLAQDDLIVPLAGDVLGCLQPLLDSAGPAPLEHNRLARRAHRSE